ncbi:multiple sugar transport system substrate-binding protein [Halobacillus dabanensis]|uniref:Multiple sugar transport system substrate-binding protein n=1 Tax=Halobacillus dabanensis TaxID=240302 RepID=A0A1I3RWP1_HALDA|nr:extracellular solute-binding protein [Halobacillus dabanensis]SFJ51003.1 multiple sugar transport system substrate-binding protein [Halobacillus dabanensis]
MRKSFTFIMMFSVLIIGVLAGCSGDSEEAGSNNGEEMNNENMEPEDFEGTLDIWTFFGGVEGMAESFEEKYPNVDVNVEVFPGDQYQTKLMTAIQSRTDVPDIFDLERSYMGKFINQEFVANLSDMGADELVEGQVEYVKELGTGENGDVRAISDHSSPGAFWYHRDLAKEYLGTDDPQEISEMVSSWDKIIELGQKVYEESDGEVNLLSHYGDVFNTEKQHQEQWVQDGKLVVDPAWKDIFNNMKQIRENNVDAKLGYFSGGWGDALNEGGVIMFAMPAWGGFMIDNEDGKAEGKYGIAKTPSGYYEGGTYRSIYEGSDNKQLAYEFVRYISSEEWQNKNLEETGNMPALTSVYEENLDSYTHEFFGEQKILEQYYDLVQDVPAHEAGENNNDISTLFYDAASSAIDGGQSYEQAIEKFKKSVANGYPEIEIE